MSTGRQPQRRPVRAGWCERKHVQYYFSCLSMQWKLLALAGPFILALSVVFTGMYMGLQEVKVGGPIYSEIVMTKDLVADVFRHRLVLSYEALTDEVTADDLVGHVLRALPVPDIRPHETVLR
mgnify:CR=1 FL=1